MSGTGGGGGRGDGGGGVRLGACEDGCLRETNRDRGGEREGVRGQLKLCILGTTQVEDARPT